MNTRFSVPFAICFGRSCFWRRLERRLGTSQQRAALRVIAVALVAVFALVACEPNSSPSSGAAPAIATAPAPTTSAPTMMPAMMPPGDGGTTMPLDGKSWGPAVEISNSTVSGLRGSPQVGIDGSGSAVAVWLEELANNTRNAVWASRYTAGGAWSNPQTIDNAVGNASAPQLAMTPSGTAVAVFVQSDSNQGGQTALVTNRFISAWGTTTAISTMGQNPERQALAVGADGAATVAFQAPDAMFPRAWGARSSAAGVWDTETAMGSNAQPGWTPAVTVAANGDAVMTWTETGGGPSQTSLWASRHHGGVWEAPALLSTDSGQVLDSIVVGSDADGNALAIWSQRLAGLYTLRSARMAAATGAWSAAVTVNDGKREVTSPHLGVDAAGDAVAVWFETDYGVMANRFLASTATWGTPVLV
ncbi:MAG: hypothetical protein QOI41_400, partial [Myxococcales bacterium]|nr:hypothetical protein [Myxococcales bacterium]